MNAQVWILVGVAVALAVTDWWAVAVERRKVEYVFKPATMIALLGVALSLDGPDAGERAWFLAALGLSLAGDVFLMLPADHFVAGLASFLLAHVAYIGGIAAVFTPALWAVVLAAAAVAGVAIPLGRRIVRGAREHQQERLVAPVTAYILVISAMVVAALASGSVLAAAGAALFYGSDALIGWTRFVAPIRHGRVLVMVTYHLGQVGLVLSLT